MGLAMAMSREMSMGSMTMSVRRQEGSGGELCGGRHVFGLDADRRGGSHYPELTQSGRLVLLRVLCAAGMVVDMVRGLLRLLRGAGEGVAKGLERRWGQRRMRRARPVIALVVIIAIAVLGCGLVLAVAARGVVLRIRDEIVFCTATRVPSQPVASKEVWSRDAQ
jgi:hypothetical protein